MIRRLLRSHRRRRRRAAWRGACAGGAPVPDDVRCAHAECDSLPLTALRPGDAGTVSCLGDPGSARTYKLAALGVLPGTRIVLLQRHPVYVFRMGYTDLALDAELARRVRVQLD
ncbi:MAG TPA: FeoA family protein [Longimicrobiales bacterium]|nr:FeoA family protein [Longimicrobiales bacterium]